VPYPPVTDHSTPVYDKPREPPPVSPSSCRLLLRDISRFFPLQHPCLAVCACRPFCRKHGVYARSDLISIHTLMKRRGFFGRKCHLYSWSWTVWRYLDLGPLSSPRGSCFFYRFATSSLPLDRVEYVFRLNGLKTPSPLVALNPRGLPLSSHPPPIGVTHPFSETLRPRSFFFGLLR